LRKLGHLVLCYRCCYNYSPYFPYCFWNFFPVWTSCKEIHQDCLLGVHSAERAVKFLYVMKILVFSDCFSAAGDCLVEVIEAQWMWIAFVERLCTINLWAFWCADLHLSRFVGKVNVLEAAADFQELHKQHALASLHTVELPCAQLSFLRRSFVCPWSRYFFCVGAMWWGFKGDLKVC